MIQPSQRLQALPGYPLAEIPTIKRRLLQAGVDVIDLGAGDNDVPADARGLVLSYQPIVTMGGSRAIRVQLLD